MLGDQTARCGRLQDATLRDQRVSEDEVLQAVRQEDFGNVADVYAVVLETDGSFSVIEVGLDRADDSALRNVVGCDLHSKP